LGYSTNDFFDILEGRKVVERIDGKTEFELKSIKKKAAN